MESSVQRSHHCFDILEGISPQDDDFNSTFLPNTNFHVPLHSLPPNSSTHTNNNDSLDRRERRMVCNRESARRSRMRTKKHIEVLHQQVEHLMILNHNLSEKVIHLLESNHQILQENSHLKERVSSFQLLMTEMQIPMRNVDGSISDQANAFFGR